MTIKITTSKHVSLSKLIQEKGGNYMVGSRVIIYILSTHRNTIEHTPARAHAHTHTHIHTYIHKHARTQTHTHSDFNIA